MDLRNAYERMLYIRVAEEELVKLYLDQKLFSMVHFYIGEEAIAVGVADALRSDDAMLGNHRSHGHYLAKGGDFDRMAAELLGRATGLAHGKGGSMHMVDRSVNFMGSTPILGSGAPIAAGIAFSQKYRKRDAVTAVFYGDGASEEGVVYETYNIAGLYGLPILFVIENNGFSINSALEKRRAPGYDVQAIAGGFGLLHERADGNDYEDVHAKASVLVERMRAEQRPALLECTVYRHMAHSTPLMDEKYRTVDTVEERAAQDSLQRLKKKLIGEGASAGELDALEEKLRGEVRAGIEQAQAAPYPERAEMSTDMYA